MIIYIRLIANEPLLNALISYAENYCNVHGNPKIVVSSSTVYWKNINLRESELCLTVNKKFSQEYATDIIAALFRLQKENATIVEDDEICEINYYAQVDDLISFPDKLFLFSYINKRE